MVLADTSVWIDHFRRGLPELSSQLGSHLVLTHPFVIGELACGNLRNRRAVLMDLQRLPQAVPASQREVLHLIESRQLWGKGLGWADVHLLSSALLSDCRLWTLDKRLHTVAVRLGLA
jgi:predicted nucleic acid-binding protein